MHLVALTGLIILASACSAAPPAMSKSDADPSNSAAPQGGPLVVPSRTEPEPPAGPAAAVDAGSAAAPHSHSHGAHAAPTGSASAESKFTCPMHPEVVSTSPGRCPKCGMDLVPKK